MKKIIKYVSLIILSIFTIYIINFIYIFFHIKHGLSNLESETYIKNLEIISYKPSNGIDDNFYIYEKESLIPTFIPQDIILIKRKGGKVQIWYGGRLSKFPEWFQINIDAAYEEKKCHPSTDISSYIENTLSREGFLKLN